MISGAYPDKPVARVCGEAPGAGVQAKERGGADEILDKFTTPGELLGAIRRIRTEATADTI